LRAWLLDPRSLRRRGAAPGGHRRTASVRLSERVAIEDAEARIRAARKAPAVLIETDVQH